MAKYAPIPASATVGGKKPKRYKPLLPASQAGDAAFRRAGPKTTSSVKKGTSKKNTGGYKINDPGQGAFGILTPEEIDKMARDAAAQLVGPKRAEIDRAIAQEQANAQANAEFMKQIYAEFMPFIANQAGQIQDIYARAGKDAGSFNAGVIDGMNAVTGGVNAGINANLSAINAPAGQYVGGDFGAAGKLAENAQAFGNLLAAQGANWAAWVAVQPGIYSRFAVYNIGKLMKESAQRVYELELKKIGLSDDEASLYAENLANLQKDQYDRQVDYYKYLQGERDFREKQRRWELDYNFRVAAENNKNARLQATLDAAANKPAKPLKIDYSTSKLVGHLVYTDGSDYLRNGKIVPVKKTKEKPNASVGKISVEASKAAGRWVDAYGNPVPGMEGVPPPPRAGSTKGKTGKTPQEINRAAQINREKEWGRISKDIVGKAQTAKNSKATREQAAARLLESYRYWVNQFSSPGSGRDALMRRLKQKIDRVLNAVYGKPGKPRTGKGGSTNTFTGTG